jgi:hypothetical protein
MRRATSSEAFFSGTNPASRPVLWDVPRKSAIKNRVYGCDFLQSEFRPGGPGLTACAALDGKRRRGAEDFGDDSHFSGLELGLEAGIARLGADGRPSGGRDFGREEGEFLLDPVFRRISQKGGRFAVGADLEVELGEADQPEPQSRKKEVDEDRQERQGTGFVIAGHDFNPSGQGPCSLEKPRLCISCQVFLEAQPKR